VRIEKDGFFGSKNHFGAGIGEIKMDIRITPGRLHGTVTPPGSKSQSHRLILCACLAGGVSRIDNLAFSQDIEATLSCARALGARVTVQGNSAEIQGIGEQRQAGTLPRFDCAESGSTLRFMIPVALAVCGGGMFTGRGRLLDRPQEPYLAMFRQKGITCHRTADGLTVEGRLTPGTYELPGNVSSQFFTGLLYALPLLDGESVIRATTEIESKGYISMTLAALAAAGVKVEQLSTGFALGAQHYQPICASVEADWSQAAFWVAAKALGSELSVCGMNPESVQGDQCFTVLAQKLSRAGDVAINVSQCPDLVPPLAALAAVRQGTCLLHGAARLRMKESDRLSSIAYALGQMGADVTEQPEALLIRGKDHLTLGREIDCCGDHRIAMMCAIAATASTEGITILRGADCVRKSYPDFWEQYRALGGKADVINMG
jgi:3-phosphoshikimate 1-carboxyvinyltransferase